MNKKLLKLCFNLILIILILFVVVNALIFAFTALWLRTYQAFTAKTYIAQITVSNLNPDSNGNSSFDLTLQQIKPESILNASDNVAFEPAQKFSLIGNEFRIGGQIVKFQDLLSFLGLKTVFKLSRLESSFLDAQLENKYGRSVYDLNGGVDPFSIFLQNNEQYLKVFIDTAMGDYPGKDVQNTTQIYDLYVTEEGFLLTKK